MDDAGNVFMVQDAPGMELLYRVSLERQGMKYPETVLP